MIAPDTRLLWVVAIAGVPLCALGPFAVGISVVGVTILFSVAAWDAWRALRSMREIRVASPKLLRWFKDRETTLTLDVENPRGLDFRMHLDLPAAIDAAQTEQRNVMRCMPRERGQFIMAQSEIEIRSALGLWRARGVRKLSTEIRVYPDLRGDRASLLLARHSIGTQHQRQIGKGREFEKLREYLPGDSYDEIHWKASARRGKPVVKVFQIERTQQIYVVIDGSRLSARAHVLEHYVKAALAVALTAENQGDRFGLVAFSGQVDRFVRAGAGKTHFAICRDAIYTMQPKRVSPDFAELFTFLQLQIRRRALLLFLTALDDPLLAEQFAKDVRLLSRRHLVLVNVPQQTGVRPLFSGPPPASIEEMYGDLAGHLQWTKLRELERMLRREGVALTAIDPVRAGAQLAQQYLNVKRRQAL